MGQMLFGVIVALMLAPLQAAADERPPENALHRVTIRLTEYRFDPPRIAVQLEEDTELTLVNEGTVLHEFITEALTDTAVDVDVNGVVTETLGIAELEIPPQATVVLRFTPTKAGEFSMFCGAAQPKNHLKAGMKGTLIVH